MPSEISRFNIWFSSVLLLMQYFCASGGASEAFCCRAVRAAMRVLKVVNTISCRPLVGISSNLQFTITIFSYKDEPIRFLGEKVKATARSSKHIWSHFSAMSGMHRYINETSELLVSRSTALMTFSRSRVQRSKVKVTVTTFSENALFRQRHF